MNVGQLLDRVYKATGGKYNDRFDIVDLFNQAQSILTDDAKIEATSTVTTVINQDNYPLPADFKAPISLIDGTISNPNFIYPLINIDEHRFGHALFGSEIYIKPTPNEVKTLNLYYYKHPVALVLDADVPGFDPFYHYLLSTYAIYNIMLIPDSGNFDKGTYDRAYADWENGRQNFLKAQSRKQKRTRVNEKVVW